MYATLRITEQAGPLAESWVKLEDNTFLYTERQQGWEFPQWGLLEDNLAREKAHFLLQMVGHKANSKLDA